VLIEGLTWQTHCIIKFGLFTGSVYIEGGLDGEFAMVDPTLIQSADEMEITPQVAITEQPLVLTGAGAEIYSVDCTGLEEVRVRAATVTGAAVVEMQAA
jgi:hypothetical protein